MELLNQLGSNPALRPPVKAAIAKKLMVSAIIACDILVFGWNSFALLYS
jgi:hypothetical protein